MKLYASPGGCSFSPHVALRESGLPFTLVLGSTPASPKPGGVDMTTIHAKGYTPLLERPDGERLSEGPAIVQYIADLVPEKRLAPPSGTLARYRLQEWLNYITSELHKSYSPLFYPATPEAYRPLARDYIVRRYGVVDTALASAPYLLGEFSVADPYLYVVTTWAAHVGVDLARYQNVQAFMARMAARPTVREAHAAERELKGASA